ncbi:MAG: NAD-dependent epimerase/dehydratase family protein [Polyangiaceae bacterium]|jgi:dolichol-phosphate mannosyltransferase
MTNAGPTDLEDKIRRLQGPVLVLGASGFLGANLLRTLIAHRDDVHGSVGHAPAWRLDGVAERHLLLADLLVDSSRNELIGRIRPRTVFNCVGYGGYAFEADYNLIYETNLNLTAKLLRTFEALGLSCYVHSGSSSEYGDRSAGPKEDDLPQPNSDYAVSKLACANLLGFYGKKRGLPCANLRLYSVYGPYEDASRLIPALLRCGLAGEFPPLVDGAISRDFVYVDDVSEAYVDTALRLTQPFFGDSFNIGSGCKTTIAEAAKVAADLLWIPGEPGYGTLERRAWDLVDWFSNQDKTARVLGWRARIDFREGLRRTADWYGMLEDSDRYYRASKRFRTDTERSVSAVVACYMDAQAIPVMYDRLKKTFAALKIDHEIIFVNDCSPDDSEEIIRDLSSRDRHVLGISHSRNFGSQAAFRSGMELASKNACVLLDGDLQDPPELIETFVSRWKEGFDIVYGRRVKRQAPLLKRVGYKLFYRVFDAVSYLPIPHDAGDFSLIDRRAVKAILAHPERDFFLRGIRASVGFKQAGVDYVRPERLFGRTTNTWLKNIGWAKKGILSFSYAPLSVMSLAGTIFFFMSGLLGLGHIAARLLMPGLAPRGVTTIILFVLFFGSMNLLGIAILGEYVAKILEETKRRPHFVRKTIVRNGVARNAAESSRDPLS